MAIEKRLNISVMPNEILFPDSSIVIESSDSLDPESAQGGIVVRGVRGQVNLSRKGRVATWSAKGGLLPGHHTLLVRGLLTDKRQRIEEDVEIPFFVTDSKSKVPATVRVESMTRLRVQDLRTERLVLRPAPVGQVHRGDEGCKP